DQTRRRLSPAPRGHPSSATAAHQRSPPSSPLPLLSVSRTSLTHRYLAPCPNPSRWAGDRQARVGGGLWRWRSAWRGATGLAVEAASFGGGQGAASASSGRRLVAAASSGGRPRLAQRGGGSSVLRRRRPARRTGAIDGLPRARTAATRLDGQPRAWRAAALRWPVRRLARCMYANLSPVRSLFTLVSRFAISSHILLLIVFLIAYLTAGRHHNQRYGKKDLEMRSPNDLLHEYKALLILGNMVLAHTTDNYIYVFFIRFANGLFCTCQGMPWANLRLMAFGLSGDLFAAGSHCSSVMEQAHIFLFIRFGRTIVVWGHCYVLWAHIT
ncbi:hypothetical protein EJB05_31615, partial [Eragrostis curvula]